VRYSHIFGTTKRESNSSLSSYQSLLARAGLVKYAQDHVSLLHLGQRTVDKISETLVRLFSPDAQKVGELGGWPDSAWKLITSEVNSHKQLPISAYSRNGHILRIIELMSDEESAGARVEAFQNGVGVLKGELNIPLREIEATSLSYDDVVAIAVAVESEEEATAWLRCPKCGYEAELHAARPKVEPLEPSPIAEVEEVETPGCTTIASVAEYLKVQESQTLKAVFFADKEGRVVFAVIRGDLEVDPVKLEMAADRGQLHVATPEELSAAGMVPGYASPVGIPKGVLVVADESVLSGQNFVAGANRPGYHLTGVNAGRDFIPDIWADIAEASTGDPCPRCGTPLEAVRGMILARFREHGAEMSERKGMLFLNKQGKTAPIRVLSYEYDLIKLMEAVAASNHDDKGLVWPKGIAPYRFHLMTIKPKKEEVRRVADDIYAMHPGETLFDDRDASPGVKFSDADLIGLPVRITISPKSLQAGGAEVKARKEEGHGSIVPIEKLKSGTFDL
jgi:prolyl-tRNA synthetase